MYETKYNQLTSIELSVEVEVMASLSDRGEFLEDGTLPAPGDSIPESSMLDSLLLLFRMDSSTTRPYVHGVCPQVVLADDPLMSNRNTIMNTLLHKSWRAKLTINGRCPITVWLGTWSFDHRHDVCSVCRYNLKGGIDKRLLINKGPARIIMYENTSKAWLSHV